jgi:hypothetical protein
MTTGQSPDIVIPFPDVEHPQLRLTAAPGRLRLRSGEAEPWVSGTFHGVDGAGSYTLSTSGSVTHLRHDLALTKLHRGIPEFDLALGTGKPFGLILESGASDKNQCDLGGVPVTDLSVKQGAGELILDFSRPNPVELSRIEVAAGAGSLELRNLANANAAELSVTGGAASFLVDFCGALQRDMHARLNTGIADVKITAPRETALKARTNATLGSVKVGDGFMTKEGAYWSEAAVKEVTPVLTIELIVALGSVKIGLV